MSDNSNQNHSEEWVEARVKGIVDRKRFTTALHDAVYNLAPSIYGHATEEIYKVLLERTTQILRRDLNLTPRQNPRDHIDEYGLIYLRLTEKACADLLIGASTVSYNEAIRIVQTVAELFHAQASNTSRTLRIDIVTGKPLV